MSVLSIFGGRQDIVHYAKMQIDLSCRKLQGKWKI